MKAFITTLICCFAFVITSWSSDNVPKEVMLEATPVPEDLPEAESNNLEICDTVKRGDYIIDDVGIMPKEFNYRLSSLIVSFIDETNFNPIIFVTDKYDNTDGAKAVETILKECLKYTEEEASNSFVVVAFLKDDFITTFFGVALHKYAPKKERNDLLYYRFHTSDNTTQASVLYFLDMLHLIGKRHKKERKADV